MTFHPPPGLDPIEDLVVLNNTNAFTNFPTFSPPTIGSAHSPVSLVSQRQIVMRVWKRVYEL